MLYDAIWQSSIRIHQITKASGFLGSRGRDPSVSPRRIVPKPWPREPPRGPRSFHVNQNVGRSVVACRSAKLRHFLLILTTRIIIIQVAQWLWYTLLQNSCTIHQKIWDFRHDFPWCTYLQPHLSQIESDPRVDVSSFQDSTTKRGYDQSAATSASNCELPPWWPVMGRMENGSSQKKIARQ